MKRDPRDDQSSRYGTAPDKPIVLRMNRAIGRSASPIYRTWPCRPAINRRSGRSCTGWRLGMRLPCPADGPAGLAESDLGEYNSTIMWARNTIPAGRRRGHGCRDGKEHPASIGRDAAGRRFGCSAARPSRLLGADCDPVLFALLKARVDESTDEKDVAAEAEADENIAASRLSSHEGRSPKTARGCE